MNDTDVFTLEILIFTTQYFTTYWKEKLEGIFKLVEEISSYLFVFDSRSGKFVSHDVFYGIDYVNINFKSR